MLPFSNVWMVAPIMENFLHQIMLGRMDKDVLAKLEAAHNSRQATLYSMHGKSAVIDILGFMQKDESWWGTSCRETRRAVESAAADDFVDRIILRIDSGGGSVDGLMELADTVFTTRSIKPIIAQVDSFALSAAYYVASQATTINMGKMDAVGSIGTRMALYDFSEQFKNEGIKAIAIDTGIHKSTGMMGRPISDEEIQELQENFVNIHFESFLEHVAKGRNMDMDSVRALADGRVFMGEAAIENGLADNLISTDDFIRNMVTEDTEKETERVARQHEYLKAKNENIEITAS